VELKLAPVGVDELAKRVPVARAGAAERAIRHHSASSMTSPLRVHYQDRHRLGSKRIGPFRSRSLECLNPD
jgi:hypothetical protein